MDYIINSDRAVYSDLNPRDGGQSLYPMCTVPAQIVNRIRIGGGSHVFAKEYFRYLRRVVASGNMQRGPTKHIPSIKHWNRSKRQVSGY